MTYRKKNPQLLIDVKSPHSSEFKSRRAHLLRHTPTDIVIDRLFSRKHMGHNSSPFVSFGEPHWEKKTLKKFD